MVTLKISPIGNSVGVVLPKEALANLKVQKGDTVFLTESPEGFLLTRYDPEFEAQMNLALGIMDEYKDALHQLAK
ncbi:MAG: AbrB/MazE/SpoVT family DNA-binding domain-containing protein [Acidobacteriota bacterium]|nr:AbrB/MazE/SpoVT family DNA-binding domain-containing protein [Acidobacteriota bacterium]